MSSVGSCNSTRVQKWLEFSHKKVFLAVFTVNPVHLLSFQNQGHTREIQRDKMHKRIFCTVHSTVVIPGVLPGGVFFWELVRDARILFNYVSNFVWFAELHVWAQSLGVFFRPQQNTLEAVRSKVAQYSFNISGTDVLSASIRVGRRDNVVKTVGQ